MSSMRILVTTTSFQDTPGPHHRMLEESGHELLRGRGPLSEARMLDLVGEIDGMICGDDAITADVIDKALPRLKAISKYGIGLDKIDVAHATKRRLPVLFTPGVNHTTVAEHAMGLMLCLGRRIPELVEHTRKGEWKRITGHELAGSVLGVIGLGRIGREVVKRAQAFGMEIVAYGNYWDDAFAQERGLKRAASLGELLREADIVTLHTALTGRTRGMLGEAEIAGMKRGVLVVNCARGELVDTQAMVSALESGRVAGYAADVLDEEPPRPDHPLLRAPNCLVTPHVGSRTYESVQRQAGMACENLLRCLRGERPLARANDF